MRECVLVASKVAIREDPVSFLELVVAEGAGVVDADPCLEVCLRCWCQVNARQAFWCACCFRSTSSVASSKASLE